MVFSLLAWLAMQPDPASIRRLFEENVARCERKYGAADARTGQAARDLGLFLKEQGDTGGARDALARALRIDEQALGAGNGQTLADAAELAAVSPPAPAQALWQRAAASRDPELAARALAALGDLRSAEEDQASAVSLYRKALAKQEEATGKDSARVAVRLNALAVVVSPREGVSLLERALAINLRLLGPRHPETSTTQANLAGLLLNTGRPDAAIQAANQALAGLEETVGPEHPRTASVCFILASCWRHKGDRVRAERLYRRALSIDEKAYGPRRPETLEDVRALAELLREAGRTREAAELEKRLPGVER
jgi:tetratricopeptide (TPR) repeat protein